MTYLLRVLAGWALISVMFLILLILLGEGMRLIDRAADWARLVCARHELQRERRRDSARAGGDATVDGKHIVEDA